MEIILRLQKLKCSFSLVVPSGRGSPPLFQSSTFPSGCFPSSDPIQAPFSQTIITNFIIIIMWDDLEGHLGDAIEVFRESRFFYIYVIISCTILGTL